MTNFTKYFMGAAAVVVMAGVASAQSVKADIPFAFQVGHKLMSPGTYTINETSTGPVQILDFQNVEQRESALAMVTAKHDPSKEWKADGRPRLAFECGESRCSLAEIWDGGATSYRFPIPKSHNEKPMRTAVVTAEPVRAD